MKYITVLIALKHIATKLIFFSFLFFPEKKKKGANKDKEGYGGRRQ
jgi:hypothetical protein